MTSNWRPSPRLFTCQCTMVCYNITLHIKQFLIDRWQIQWDVQSSKQEVWKPLQRCCQRHRLNSMLSSRPANQWSTCHSQVRTWHCLTRVKRWPLEISKYQTSIITLSKLITNTKLCVDDNETDFINEKAIKPLIDILTKENNADAQTLASMTLENLSTNRMLLIS